MSRCSMCGGTGRTEPTALDRLDLAETGVMDLQCLACDGTGQTTLTPPAPDGGPWLSAALCAPGSPTRSRKSSASAQQPPN